MTYRSSGGQNQLVWLLVLVAFVAAMIPLMLWIESSPQSAFVTDGDGIWRPRVSSGMLDRPVDARDKRIRPAPSVTATGQHAFLALQEDGTTPVGYDPCIPIHYEVNATNGGQDVIRLVKSAVRKVQHATGLEFVFDGVTSRTTHLSSDSPALLKRVPVLVEWSDESAEPKLKGSIVGLGGSNTASDGKRLWYYTGQIALDGPELSGLSDALVLAVIAHEWGHVLGLDHVKDVDEIMNAESVGRAEFGPGDLQGLARLGAIRCG